MNLIIELHNARDDMWERIVIKPEFYTIIKADNRKYYQFNQFTTPYDVEITEYDYLTWRIEECKPIDDFKNYIMRRAKWNY